MSEPNDEREDKPDMIQVFETEAEFEAHLRTHHNRMYQDFVAHASELGLDPTKPYEFICLSFEHELVNKPAREALVGWATGPVRGYINQYGILCLNLPVKPEMEDQPFPEDDILGKLDTAGQEYHDLESANWECYRVSFPQYVHNVGELICLWNHIIETRRRAHE